MKRSKKTSQKSNTTRAIIALILITVAIIFTFLFVKANPAIKSTADPESLTSAKIQQCASGGMQKDCLEKISKELLGELSLKQIGEVFEQKEGDPLYFENCHTLSHYLGREAYKKAQSVKDVFAQSTYACLGGLFHGAVEGYMIERNLLGQDDSQIAKEIPNICGKQEDHKRAQDYTECHHGMGHALMYLTEDDLIRALKLCDAELGANERNLCYTGAFMQNADNATGKGHISKYFDANDPIYPCQILEEQYLEQCYTYAILVTSQGDVGESANRCAKAPIAYQKGCFNTIGRDRTMETSNENELKRQCNQIELQNNRNECYKGAAYNLVVRFNYDSPLAAKFCNSLEENFKAECFAQMGLAIQNTTADKSLRDKYCQQLVPEQNYIDECKNGI